jgi:hypothetical protein
MFWWCPGAESNHRHLHFQCSALPTELPGHAHSAGPRAYKDSIWHCPGERPNAAPSVKIGVVPKVRKIVSGVQCSAAPRCARTQGCVTLQSHLLLILLTRGRAVLVLLLAYRNCIGTGKPPVQVDIGTTSAAKRAEGIGRRPATGRTQADAPRARARRIGHGTDIRSRVRFDQPAIRTR